MASLNEFDGTSFLSTGNLLINLEDIAYIEKRDKLGPFEIKIQQFTRKGIRRIFGEEAREIWDLLQGGEKCKS